MAGKKTGWAALISFGLGVSKGARGGSKGTGSKGSGL